MPAGIDVGFYDWLRRLDSWVQSIATGGGGGIWTRDAVNGELYPTTLTDEVAVGTADPTTNFHIYEDNADTVPALLIEQDSTGDAALRFYLTGGQNWSVGLDNSNDDKLKFAAGANVNTNTCLTILTTGEVGFLSTNPAVHVEIFDNDDSTVPNLAIEQNSTGDAAMRFILTGGQAYSFGIDNSDADKLKISTNSGDVGTSTHWTMLPGGDIGIGTDAPLCDLHVADGGATCNVRIDGFTNQDAQISFCENRVDRWLLEYDGNGTFNTDSFAFYDHQGIQLVMLLEHTTGFVGIGPSDPAAHLDVEDQTVNTTVSYTGIRSLHIKTAGATDAADIMTGHYLEFQMNQNVGTIGGLYGYDSNVWLVDGTVDGEVKAGEFLAYQTGGTTDYLVGLRVSTDQNAGTANNDAYGISVLMDLDGTVTGTSYMLHMVGFTGVDYGVYQVGASYNYFQSDMGIGIALPTSKFHAYENADASGRPVALIEQDHATGGHAVLEIQQDDADEPFILFTGTVDAGKTEADEYLRVETPAGDRYIRLYT